MFELITVVFIIGRFSAALYLYCC